MRRAVPFVLRMAVSIVILALVLSQVSFDELARRAQGGALGPLAAALSLVLLMAVLMTLRWRTLARWFGLALPVTLAVRAVFLGLFGGQLLPATLGTDLVRGGLLARHTGSIRGAAASVVADRLVALFAACALCAATYPFLGGGVPPLVGALSPVAALASLALLAGFLLAFGAARQWNLEAAAPIVAAILVAIAIHAIAVLAAAATAAAYGVEASPLVWLAIIPISLMACALPISVNGWGVREAVIVALAARHGIAEADALLVSLTLGALNILVSLPGAYLLVAGMHRPAHGH